MPNKNMPNKNTTEKNTDDSLEINSQTSTEQSSHNEENTLPKKVLPEETLIAEDAHTEEVSTEEVSTEGVSTEEVSTEEILTDEGQTIESLNLAAGDSTLETDAPTLETDDSTSKADAPTLEKEKKSKKNKEKKKTGKRRLALKIFLNLAMFGMLAGLIGGFLIYQWAAKDLPSFSKIADYRPPLVTTVLARDGSVMGEFYNERRYLVGLNEISKFMPMAVLATEDSSFYEHSGINLRAIFRALLANFESGSISQGGSTITQQVVKRLMLTPERSYERKIKEAILAVRLETQLSKNDILSIYLNQIYFGNGSYGIEAAARGYFAKNAIDLTLAESALIAGLPQAPSTYNPYRNPEKAINRQHHVLRRMLTLGWIDDQQYEEALYEELVFTSVSVVDLGPEVDWYMEEVRRQLTIIFSEENFDEFGFGFGIEPENFINEMGLTIYTSMDPLQQEAAHYAVQQGLEEATKRHGWLGPLENIELSSQEAWMTAQTFRPEMLESDEWVKALVTSVEKSGASVYLGRHENFIFEGFVDVSTMAWARVPNKNIAGKNLPKSLQMKDATTILTEGDVIWVSLAPEELRPEDFDITILDERIKRLVMQLSKAEDEAEAAVEAEAAAEAVAEEKDDAEVAVAEEIKIELDPDTLAEITALTGITDYTNLNSLLVTSIPLALNQWPNVEGALVSVEPKTGDVVALIGGYQFGNEGSFFNRATQSKRQTGSAFKPFVYSAALDQGFTAASMILDAPIVLTDPSTREVWRPGNYEDNFVGYIPLYLALARSRNLCTVRIVQEMGIDKVVDRTSSFNMDTVLVNSLSLSLGTMEVSPLDLTQAYTAFADSGTVTKARVIQKIEGPWGNLIYEETPAQFQAISEENAYVVARMLQGAVEFGSAWRARHLGYYVAAKTGTTNDENDAWFVAFTPNIVTSVYVGYDQMQPMGSGETGSGAAGPIYAYYANKALRHYPRENFVPPAGVSLVLIDKKEIPFYLGTEPTLLEIETIEESISASKTTDEDQEETGNAPAQTAEGLFKQLF